MRRRIPALLAALILACTPAFAEEGVLGLDTTVLESLDNCTVFQDDLGVDTVIRPNDQPFFGMTDAADCELVAFVDYVEMPNESAVVLRLTVSLTTPEALDAREMTLAVDGTDYVFTVTPDTQEYDGIYYEDYAVGLTDESLPMLRKLARLKDGTVPVTLAGERSLVGTIAFFPDQLAALYDRYVDLGGTSQDLEHLRELWPVRVH